MVHVAPGSWPPSWSQNEVKVLIDAEPSLYSSSVETPGPGETFSTTQVLRCHQPGWLDCTLFGSFPRILSLWSVYNPYSESSRLGEW